jgi:hypothetical protein
LEAEVGAEAGAFSLKPAGAPARRPRGSDPANLARAPNGLACPTKDDELEKLLM